MDEIGAGTCGFWAMVLCSGGINTPNGLMGLP